MIAGLAISGLALRRGERVLFDGLDLRLAAGEAVALTGPNGAGKTTLLRAIAGLVAPESGTIAFATAPGVDAAEARARDLHLLGHLDGLKTSRTAREEIAFQRQWCGGAAGADAAEALGLSTLLDLEVRRLSAGQRRRVALARLLAAPRSLWLLDEPMAPLDAAWRERFGAIMAVHLQRGGLIVAAVHDPLPIAARAVDLAR